MAEQMTSREGAATLKNAINGISKDFERMGFDRAQIGASLAGIGLAMVQVHVSHDRALEMVETLRDLLLADKHTN
jgi:rhamnogalacturonyl hydrolase YesR